MLGTGGHGLPHLGAEATLGESDRLARNVLPVEPGGARRGDLCINVQIGAHGERDAALATRVIELSEFDDRARRAVAGRIEVGQFDMMGASVHAIHHGVGRPVQLVIETAFDQSPDNGQIEAFRSQDIVGGAAVDTALRQCLVHPLDNVAALTQFAQRLLDFGLDEPLCVADLAGESEGFELAQTTDLQGVELVGLLAWNRRKVDDPRIAPVANKLTVELCPAFGVDLPLEGAANIEIGAWPQFLSDEIARSVAHPFLDVVARDDEVLAVVTNATDDQMDMRMLGVPVIDRHPVEPGAEIFFHLPDEIAGEGSEVGHLQRVVGRDDEAEMMPVVLAALGEGAGIRVFASRPEQTGLLPVSGHALAAQIVEMLRQRCGPGRMAHDARLDDGATRARSDEAVGLDAGALTMPEARAIAGHDAARARHAAAGLLRRCQCLRDEGLGPLRARRADAARPDTEFALIGHGAALQCAKAL